MLRRAPAALALALAAAAPAAAQDWPEATGAGAVREIAARSVVQIEKGRFSGTGFIVSDEGHVITAWHVLDNISRNSANRLKNRLHFVFDIYYTVAQAAVGAGAPRTLVCRARAKLVGGSSYSDVAVLKIRRRFWQGGADAGGCAGRLRPLELDGGGGGDEETALTPGGGETYVVIGHPETCGDGADEVCIERWEASLRREEDAAGRIELHSRAQTGSSGGPVVTSAGRLVGMTVATGIDQDNPVIKVVPRDMLQRALWEFGVDERLGDYVDEMRYILSKKAQIVDLIAMLEKMDSGTLDRLLQTSRDVEEMLSRPSLANARIERRNAQDPTPIVKLALSRRSAHAASPARLEVTVSCALAPDAAFNARMDARGGGVRLRYFGEMQRRAQRYAFAVETTARATGGFVDPESGQATLAGKDVFISFNRPVNEMLARCREAHLAFARAEGLGVERLDLNDFASLALMVTARFEGDRSWTHSVGPFEIPLGSGS